MMLLFIVYTTTTNVHILSVTLPTPTPILVAGALSMPEYAPFLFDWSFSFYNFTVATVYRFV